MSRLIPLLAMLILPACESGPYPVDSPYYQIPAGSRIIVKQNLTIPANQARVNLQYGKPVTPKELDQYHAHCWFLSWKRLKKSQTIIPDTFVISRVRHLEEVVFRQGGLMLASNSELGYSGINSSPTAIEYKTEMTIKSEIQPDIRQLVCNHWEDPLDAKHLTVPEIGATLGNFAELTLKGSP